MKFTIEREQLIKSLQKVSNLLGDRSVLPILGNLLLQVSKNILSITKTDLEMEIIAHVSLKNQNEPGSTTVSSRKFFEICRELPEGAEINVMVQSDKIIVSSGRSRFSLATLPVKDFPNLDDWKSEVELTLTQVKLKHLIESTQFSMAYQDVRYCLNGMLIETEGKKFRTVTTDGHRLAICSVQIEQLLPNNSAIIPRKGVVKLVRMLENAEIPTKIQIGSNNIRVHVNNFIFTSKLVEGYFPDYRPILQKKFYKTLEVERNLLKQAFSRVSILSHEKFRGVCLHISRNQLRITSNNSIQEEAEEILDIIYNGDDLKIRLNASYILDVLNVLKCEKVHLLLTDSVSSIQIEDKTYQNTTYIIMPMRS